jgi:hypothetical protein
MEGPAMRQITVNDRVDIKQLLCDDYILGIRSSSTYDAGGFELWWYDRQNDVCLCRRSRWSDFRKQVEEHTLDHATSLLWHNRATLFLRHKVLPPDQKSQLLSQSCN